MENEQFSLCWNNFHQNLRSGFHALLQEEDLVDVTLAAEGKFLKAHKAVLSVCSPYFKKLFKANPCKHPIVILQDVQYSSLCDLLQFMYRGEVSVSQHELPLFMKVAELLQVKGLTEANASSSENKSDINGNENCSTLSTTESLEERQKGSPLFKPIEQVHSSRESSNHSPPLKKLRINEFPETNDLKMEPSDDKNLVEEDKDIMINENNFDVSLMLDTTLNEAAHFSGNWNAENCHVDSTKCDKRVNADLPNSGGLLFLRSRKGHPVLINNGHIYTLDQKQETRSTWCCVKRHLLGCEGCLITSAGPTLLSYSGHNHGQLHSIIRRLQASSCTANTTP